MSAGSIDPAVFSLTLYTIPLLSALVNTIFSAVPIIYSNTPKRGYRQYQLDALTLAGDALMVQAMMVQAMMTLLQAMMVLTDALAAAGDDAGDALAAAGDDDK